MLHLLRPHLTEDELLALRERRDHDPERRRHLEECPKCQRRYAFLRAFKTAIRKTVLAPEAAMSPRPGSLLREEGSGFMPYPEEALSFSVEPAPSSRRHHPDPATLAAYVDGALPEPEREEVRRHVLGCERCMADLLVLFPGEPKSSEAEMRAARDYFGRHGLAIRYGTAAARDNRPQLVIGLEDGPGAEVRFVLLDGMTAARGTTVPVGSSEKQVEVMVGTGRVTVSAHRDRGRRYLDVRLRELGRPARRTITIAIEETGRPVSSLAAGRPVQATLLVPDLPEFDLRIEGGWEIPVLLRFRA